MSTPKPPNHDDKKLKSKVLKQDFKRKKKKDRHGCDKKENKIK